MSERYDADETFASSDPLAPERIEETILVAQARWVDGSQTEAEAEVTLVRAIAAAYALPPAADAALARVHARLRSATLALERPAEKETGIEYERSWGWRNEPTPLKVRHGPRFGASLRAIAAVLVVALLGAGFYAVLHRPGGRHSATTDTEQPGWHDVGITQARATQPLDFDPAQGVRYAVNEVTGGVYACGGSGHIWYSANGGASYAPFLVIPPASPQGSVSCTIATVPGDSGLFIRLAGTSGLTQRVAHASFPGRLAALLQPPSSAVSIADASKQITVNPDQFLAMLFAGGMIGPVRMAGGWLYTTVWDEQLSRTVLLGTPDFGQHWYWLDAPITAHSPVVVDRFAVDPADPSRLFLGVRPGTTADGVPSIAMSTDGGKTWQPMLSDSPYGVILIGASKTTAFGFTQDDVAGNTALLQYDLTRPDASWQSVAQLPSGSSLLNVGMFEVGPDGTVYDVKEGSTVPQDTVRAYTLAPGASAFRLIWPQTTFTIQARRTAFSLGSIWPGGQPALYVDGGSSSDSTRALYRLALSVPASSLVASTPSTTVTSSPAANACTGTTADLAAIQPCSLGAQLGTFPECWGAQTGSDTENLYFGKWPDTGAHKLGVGKPGADQRVLSLSYYPTRRSS